MTLKAPKADDSWEAKGDYALKSMVLFRPWRSAWCALQKWLGDPKLYADKNPDVIWQALHEEYHNWRATLMASAAPYKSTDPCIWRPAPTYNSCDWWACMTERRLQNLDLVCARHTQHSTRPTYVNGLPVEEDFPIEADECAESCDSEASDATSQRSVQAVLADMESDEELKQPRVFPPVPGKLCGTLPLGVMATEFLSQPIKTKKNQILIPKFHY